MISYEVILDEADRFREEIMEITADIEREINDVCVHAYISSLLHCIPIHSGD